MRKYLATLHKRPPHHKKRFALLTSGAFTLLIFAVWALVNFGEGDETPAAAEKSLEVINPLESLKNNFSDLRDSTLDIYGR
ncbi:MAG: hypothetical protein AAB641_00925 [Patescibacteria group bacterium]